MESKIPIWLDCDPGNDDTMAIILSYYNAKLKLLGISTVKGNVSVRRCTINACNILYSMGAEGVEVVEGAEKPLCGVENKTEEARAGTIHGTLGIGTDKFENGKFEPLKKKAIIHMADVIMASETKVTLVATGPMTNFAHLLGIFPEVKNNIEKIVFMGGAIGQGNVNPNAEYNIFVDPEAAHIVMNSGLPCVMVPLEVTHTAVFDAKIKERLAEHKTRFMTGCLELLEYYLAAYKNIYKFDGCPVHDPCAIAYVIAPEMFDVVHCNVEVDRSFNAKGRTVCDTYDVLKKEKNVHVAVKMKVDWFWEQMINALVEASGKSRIEDSK